MIRKLIAFVLTAAMALSLLTVSGAGALEARAEGEIELSSLEDVVAALGSNTRESLGTKTYKLTANISVGTTAAGGSNLYVLGDEDITLDLAGYRLRSLAFRSFITVQGGGTFTLIDSVGGGSLEAYYNATSTSTSTSRAVYLTGEGSTFNLVSGTIKSYVTNGSYDGYTQTSTLKGNLIYAADGTSFNMTGGTVTELPPLATTSTSGGMIYLGNGTHTISGGTISNGISSSGGNILLNKGTLTISGDDTLVTGGTAKYGGNIRNNGTLYINGGTISDGVSSALFGDGPSGANLYLAADSVTVIDGAVISGNPATNPSYSIYSRGNASVTVRDGEISSNINNEGTFVIEDGLFSGRFNNNTAAAVSEINGGVFTGTVTSTKTDAVTAAVHTVNGGFFAVQQPQEGVTTLGEGRIALGECADTPDSGAPYGIATSGSYTVSYKLSDGTDAAEAAAKEHGQKVTIPGYTPASGTFGGWFFDDEFKNAAPAAGAEVEFSKDTTLYAWVSAAAIHEITVSIDGVEVADLSGSYAEGSTFTLPAAPDRGEFFTFDGYSTTEGGEIEYQAGGTYTVTADGAVNFYTNYTEAERLASLTTGEKTTYAHSAAELAAMVEAAAEDTDITILKDFELSSRINTMSGRTADMVYFTLDFNGHTLTYTGNSRGFINVRAYATMTVRDSIGGGGVFFESPYATKTLVYSNTNTAITIESGRYTGNYTEVSNPLTAGGPNPRVNVKGGVYSMDPSDYIQDTGRYEAVADTPETGLFTVQEKTVIQYAASVKINDDEPVFYSSYADAIAAAGAVDTENAAVVVTLLEDILDGTQNITFDGTAAGRSFTLDLGGFKLTRNIGTRPYTFNGEYTVTIKNGTIDANGKTYTAGNGSFARIRGGATVNFENLDIIGFTAGTNGTTKRNGALYLEETATVNITDCSFTDIHSDGNGGVIYATNAAITIKDSTFDTVSADGNGGVIYATKAAITIKDSTFDTVSADGNAGCIYARATQLTMENVSIGGATAGSHGGAVIIERNSGIITTADLKNVDFKDCAATGDGGALYVAGSCTATLDADSSFDGCSAKNGAAIFVLSNNSTDESGVRTQTASGIAKLNGTVITNCASSGEGFGGHTAPICSQGFVYIDGVLTTDGIVYQCFSAGVFEDLSASVTGIITLNLTARTNLIGEENAEFKYTDASGEAVAVPGTVNEETGLLEFAIPVKANHIADEITLDLWAGGNRIATTTYSVLDYLNAAAELDTTTADQKTFMANMIVYADLLQQYAVAEEYDNAGTAVGEYPGWVQAARTDTEEGLTTDKKLVLPAADITKDAVIGVRLSIGELISLKVRIVKQAESTVVITRKDAGADTVALTEGTDFTVEDGMVTIGAISPAFYDSVFTISIENGGKAVHTVTYSVNSYCHSKIADATPFSATNDHTLAELVKAIYNYGTAAAALS